MAKISKALVDEALRNTVFDALHISEVEGFYRINARQWGCLVQDMNGVERYVRIGAIVAEERDDCSAAQLMASEIADYEAKQVAKAEKAAARKAKAEKDAAKRAAEKEKKEKEKEGV